VANPTQIIFDTKFGDVQSAVTVDPHINALSDLIERYCNKRYSPHFDRFSSLGKIDGNAFSWGDEGCDSCRLNVERRIISIDIGMSINGWLHRTDLEIRTFLYTHLEEALQLMVNMIKSKQLLIDDQQLFTDFSLVKQDYLHVM